MQSPGPTRRLAGLTEGERPGRPTRLNAAQLREVDRVLRGRPTDAGMPVNLWDGKTLAAWIKKKYGIQLGVRQCQRLFRRFGFRLQAETADRQGESCAAESA